MNPQTLCKANFKASSESHVQSLKAVTCSLVSISSLVSKLVFHDIYEFILSISFHRYLEFHRRNSDVSSMTYSFFIFYLLSCFSCHVIFFFSSHQIILIYFMLLDINLIQKHVNSCMSELFERTKTRKLLVGQVLYAQHKVLC